MPGILMSRNTRSGASRSISVRPSWPVAAPMYVVALVFQDHPQRSRMAGLVIDDQDAGFHRSGPAGSARVDADGAQCALRSIVGIVEIAAPALARPRARDDALEVGDGATGWRLISRIDVPARDAAVVRRARSARRAGRRRPASSPGSSHAARRRRRSISRTVRPSGSAGSLDARRPRRSHRPSRAAAAARPLGELHRHVARAAVTQHLEPRHRARLRAPRSRGSARRCSRWRWPSTATMTS